MVWSKEWVAGEYQSVRAHMNPKQFMHDNKRASALDLSGYKVINITYDYMKNFNTYQSMYDSFRCALGIKSDRRKMEKYYDVRHSLFKFLLRQCQPYKPAEF